MKSLSVSWQSRCGLVPFTASPVTPSGSDYSNSYRGSPCSSTAGSNVSSINRKLDNVMAVFAEQAELLAQSNEASKNTI